MKILIVEDEELLAKALKKILNMNNYNADIAVDGDSALFYCKEQAYDLILLDMMLPKKSGLEVLKEIRNAKMDVPVLVLTAKTLMDDKVDTLNVGADDYMTKPFDKRELLARIKSLLRRGNVKIQNQLEFGDLVLDLESYTLNGPSNKFPLGKKEFSILEVLMKNKGLIVETNYLINNIWDIDSNADENTLWVYISYIRKKLKLLNSMVELKVKRGVGYMLEINCD